jgi:hypothetical protein
MQIKRKLVGTQAEMIEYLREAYDAVATIDENMSGQREDTRIKKGERRGYMDGLIFAIRALQDWEPSTTRALQDWEPSTTRETENAPSAQASG